MGLRFRKSFKIAPGVKLNLNKNSTSVTFGGRGAHYTINSKGKRTTTLGIPGTGISYSQTTGGTKTSKKAKQKKGGTIMLQNQSLQNQNSNFPHEANDDNDGKKWYQKTVWIIVWICLCFPVGLFLMWKYADWKKPVKWVITAPILGYTFVCIIITIVAAFAPPSKNYTKCRYYNCI